jgi:hypothetical protein
MPKAIGLDDQCSVPPEEIHLEGADTGVHLRLRKAVAATEVEQGALELAAGQLSLLRWILIPLRFSLPLSPGTVISIGPS